MQIQPAISAPIDDRLEVSGKKFSTGDLKGLLDIALQAWDLIPAPKSDWNVPCHHRLDPAFSGGRVLVNANTRSSQS
ncbi:hypothetical protein QO004_001697 [Rhizobium mesoamericanum]|uniref:hypothetical protein n=1 Tax=Rhizobium mesoamericanum TaxID=1079800 RepID=UPI002786ACD8|nr:hypothetical protein [Rhizobium mesoamericanum]MDQ0559915.1 hypothetical protein [Rhizobium mesoamericanum]